MLQAERTPGLVNAGRRNWYLETLPRNVSVIETGTSRLAAQCLNQLRLRPSSSSSSSSSSRSGNKMGQHAQCKYDIQENFTQLD
jgi:hypothetical protein